MHLVNIINTLNNKLFNSCYCWWDWSAHRTVITGTFWVHPQPTTYLLPPLTGYLHVSTPWYTHSPTLHTPNPYCTYMPHPRVSIFSRYQRTYPWDTYMPHPWGTKDYLLTPGVLTCPHPGVLTCPIPGVLKTTYSPLGYLHALTPGVLTCPHPGVLTCPIPGVLKDYLLTPGVLTCTHPWGTYMPSPWGTYMPHPWGT